MTRSYKNLLSNNTKAPFIKIYSTNILFFIFRSWLENVKSSITRSSSLLWLLNKKDFFILINFVQRQFKFPPILNLFLEVMSKQTPTHICSNSSLINFNFHPHQRMWSCAEWCQSEMEKLAYWNTVWFLVQITKCSSLVF